MKLQHYYETNSIIMKQQLNISKLK